MKKKFLIALAIFNFQFSILNLAHAGGMLTNTNQSVAFLRNPARDGAIGIDGTYSNPAGVAFMKDGWHFDVNWQCAVQTRTVETTSPYLDRTLSSFNTLGQYDGESLGQTKRYRGHATAPCIPSASAAYNKGKWSFQFHFAVSGGGGKCQYENGLGDFEGYIGQVATSLRQLSKIDAMTGGRTNFGGIKGYGVDCYMEGNQYYYGVTFGAAYKVLPTLSVYAGIRGLIASASYAAEIQNVQVATSDGLETLQKYYTDSHNTLEAMKTAYPQIYEAASPYIEQLADYAVSNGINLHSDQSGFGIAPIFGIDWKPNKYLNLAAKYEFRTKMSLTNSSDLLASNMSATAQYVDGTSIREDSPAMLSFGAQVSPIDIVRIGLGYHHFYDLDAKKFNNRQDLLSKGTDEYLAGVEVDCTERLIVSCGAQITNYGNTDAFMSDQSFVTNSWSFGFGASYQANKNVKIEAAYFKTFYNDYTSTTVSGGVPCTDVFSRTNDVIGVGLVIDL